MKNFILSLMVITLGLVVKAGPVISAGGAPQMPSQVLIEQVTAIGFAPPGIAGLYKLQLLNDGQVRQVDNKGSVKILGKISKEVIQALAKKIYAIKDVQLEQPDSPACMDAPTSSINTYKMNNQRLVIWENQNCQIHQSSDYQVQTIANQFLGLVEFFRF